MPIYTYRCPVCHDTRELQRKIAEMDDPVTCIPCLEARSLEVADTFTPPRMDRIMSAPAPHFPGASSWRG